MALDIIRLMIPDVFSSPIFHNDYPDLMKSSRKLPDAVINYTGIWDLNIVLNRTLYFYLSDCNLDNPSTSIIEPYAREL